MLPSPILKSKEILYNKKEMKIYLADTKQRDYLGHNIKIPCLHHLESYWAIKKDKKFDITKLTIFKKENNDYK